MAKAQKQNAKQNAKPVKATKRPRLKGSVKRRDPRAESRAYLGHIADLGYEHVASESRRLQALMAQGVSRTVARNVVKWQLRHGL